MHYFTLIMVLVTLILANLQAAAGHSLCTTLSINNVDQGDGTCVRMPMDAHNSTFPIDDLASDDMACGEYYSLNTSHTTGSKLN